MGGGLLSVNNFTSLPKNRSFRELKDVLGAFAILKEYPRTLKLANIDLMTSWKA